MDLSIIFVNWNSLDYLRECIPSIHEYTRGIEYEIIVVDNASPEKNVALLTREFPEVKLIDSSRNLGFAGANNLGVRNSSGRNLLFLNPDTKLVRSAINIMLESLNALPDAGIVGCRLLNSDFSIQTSSIQKFPTIVNQLCDMEFLRNRWPGGRLWDISPLFSDAKEPVKVEVISGACMLMRREVFEKIGYFSEDYFMYAEDLDLCYKARQAGYYNYYLGKGSIVHYGGKSSTPKWAIVMKWKSILRFFVKTRGHLYGLAFRIVMSFAALARLLAIGVLSLLGKVAAEGGSTGGPSEKWQAILKTLLTESGAASSSAAGQSTTLSQ